MVNNSEGDIDDQSSNSSRVCYIYFRTNTPGKKYESIPTYSYGLIVRQTGLANHDY